MSRKKEFQEEVREGEYLKGERRNGGWRKKCNEVTEPTGFY